MSEWITGKTPPPDQKPDKCEMCGGPHKPKKLDREKLQKLAKSIRENMEAPDTTLRSELHKLLQKHKTAIWLGGNPEVTQSILDLLAKRLPSANYLRSQVIPGYSNREMEVFIKGYVRAVHEVRAIVEGVDHV